MNFLCHMLLSGDDEQLLVGNFMGDFVKGRLENRFPEGIRRGVELHRQIDSFAARSPLFRRSRQRIAPEYGLYRGILVDLFYDNILAAGWSEWSVEPFGRFLQRSRLAVEQQRSFIPAEMQRLLPIIFNELLPSYGSVAGIAAALERMSRRITRPNPLKGGEAALISERSGFEADFREFMSEITVFIRPHLHGQVPLQLKVD